MDKKAAQPTVLVGVTGCIAAYKSCELVRALQKRGYRVKVIMTKNATEFVGTATFRALTNEPVALHQFAGAADPIYHVSLAQEADVFIIAPCTANVAAKIAHGVADDLLTTTALATPAPLLVAPAMNVNMYENAATQDNLALLRSRGITVIDAEAGYLACGDTGKGRLPEIDVLVQAVEGALRKKDDLAGKKVLITAGPTHEAIDPVRFIGNRSSGKTGFLLAEAARKRGASVTLVAGPVALDAPSGVAYVPVTTAQQMMHACEQAFPEADIAIFSAAVCDMRPLEASDRKLKKGADDDALHTIRLTENPDILKTCGLSKKPGQVVVGYAAETNDVLDNAQKKLVSKHADIIVSNDVSGGKAFGADTNVVSLVSAQGVQSYPCLSKREIADVVLDAASELLVVPLD